MQLPKEFKVYDTMSNDTYKLKRSPEVYDEYTFRGREEIQLIHREMVLHLIGTGVWEIYVEGEPKSF